MIASLVETQLPENLRTALSSAFRLHFTHLCSKVHEESLHYDQSMQRMFSDMHAENQALRTQLSSCCGDVQLDSCKQVLTPDGSSPHSSMPRQAEVCSTVQSEDSYARPAAISIKDCCEAVDFPLKPNDDDPVLDFMKEAPQKCCEESQVTCLQNHEMEAVHKFALHAEWSQTSVTSLMAHSVSYSSKRDGETHLSHGVTTQQWYCSFHPTSPVGVIWNIIFMLFLAYELILFPLRAFPIPDGGFFWVMSWVCVIFWTADLCMSFFIGVQTRSGDYLRKMTSIAQHYLRTWFVPDFIIVATDWLSTLADEVAEGISIIRIGKIVRSIRIVRALRLLRLRKLRSLVQQMEFCFQSSYVLILSSLMTNLFAILTISHFVGCLWYWIGTHSVEDGQNWVTTYLQGATWEYSYMTSFHWALTQFTPGSMNVQPQNTLERAFANMILVLGLIIFSSIVSSITNSTNSLRSASSLYSRQIWEFRKFCKQEQVSAEVILKVMKYADCIIAPRLGRINVHDVTLLKLMPPSIYIEVIQEIYDKHLTCHPFFEVYSKLDSDGMYNIYQQLTQMALDDQNILFSHGHTAHSMYFVIEGGFRYVMEPAQKKDPKLLFAGTWCCEAALWTHWVHQGTMQSIEGGDVVVLSAERFRIEMRKTQQISVILKYGASFVDSMNVALGSGIEPDRDMQSGQAQEPQTILSDLHKLPNAHATEFMCKQEGTESDGFDTVIC